MEVVLALLGIASALLLEKTTNWIQGKLNARDGLSPDDIVKVVSMITNEARSKGNRVLTELSTRLNSMQIPYGTSSLVKDKIIQARKQVNKDLKNATNVVNSVEAKLNSADNRANILASMTEEGRQIYGEQAKKQIVNDLQEPVQAIKNLEGVEQYVSK